MASVYLPLLGPVIGLNLWQFCMEGWMYYERIGYIQSSNMKVDNTMTRGQWDLKIPPKVRWKHENYNHLFEQPTQFYAVCITQTLLLGAKIAAGQKVGLTDLSLAWAYVGGRVIHSFVQCISNPIMVRFRIFIGTSLILATLTVRSAMNLFELVV